MGMTRDEYQTVIDNANQASFEVAMQKDVTIADRFEMLAESQPDKIFLIYDDVKFSYGEVDARATEYANAAIQQGVGMGDTVALMMENRVEFFYAWLGMLKIGASVALINTEAKSKAVSHAVTAVDSRLAIVGAECYQRYATGDDRLDNIPLFIVEDSVAPDIDISKNSNAQTISQAITGSLSLDFDKSIRAGLKNSATACFMFTSGTTGLPKASIITHSKWLSTGRRWIVMAGINSDDVFYCVLPIFHGAGLMSLFSSVFAVGGSCLLKRKFSARAFWQDIKQHQVTVAIYVGEICRYLLGTPECEAENNHSLRTLFGAGMGLDIWEQFVERFGSQIGIYEGWGSTESNCSLSNLDNRPGSCGRIPYRDKTFTRLVEYDVENDTHVRDVNGFGQLATVGIVGELLGQVHTGSGDVVSPFDGYTDSQATQKKLLRDVFEKGDCWFSTGDLFRYDDEDYFYFVDRIGDTFRWKSENVSTTEVVHQLSEYKDAELINVYGVKVPGAEGRAGMAAILMVEGKEFAPVTFYQLATKELQTYAIPLFIRVLESMDMTGTFKLRKVDLQRDGYDPKKVKDPLYVLDRKKQQYSPYSGSLLKSLGLEPFQ